MRAVADELLPRTQRDRETYRSIQSTVRDRGSFEDDPSLSERSPGELVAVGIDQAMNDDEIISAAVAMRDGAVIDTVTATYEATIPYIPGYLAFREGPSIVDALESLDIDPDLLLIDGNGRLHPRQAGLATHVGVVMACPAIGVAKSLLCGTLVDPPNEPWSTGTIVPIRQSAADDSNATDTLGYAVQTKQWDNRRHHINPVYVSPGHRCSPTKAVELVTAYLDGYKLPEPIRRADHLAGDYR